MLAHTDPNDLLFDRSASRFGIGGNKPPVSIDDKKPNLFDHAKQAMAALSSFLKDNPVIQSDDAARAAKLIKDRTDSALKSLEDERDALVRPLNEQVAEINARYKSIHNTDTKRPGTANKLLNELKARVELFVKAEERRRMAEAQAAAAKAAEAERIAREAEAAEREAVETAAQGVLDIDVAQATEAADHAFSEFMRANNAARRSERDTHVKIGGGTANCLSLRTREVLTVIDWRAAIDDIGLADTIRDAILTAARAYRKVNGELPDGITATDERVL